MKFSLEQSEPAQESVILGFLFGMFILPWLLIGTLVTVVSICAKISDFKDKKDPSRKLERLKKRMKDGWVSFIFNDEDGNQIDFKDADKTARITIKGGTDITDLIAKWGKWSACVADLAKINNLIDADKQIQKVFSSHFKNNELFTRQNDEDKVLFTGIKVKEIDLKYPDDIWFKPGTIDKFTKFVDAESNKIGKNLEKMIVVAKQCIEAPKTHKEEKDKPYLLGCLNYLNTIDKVIDMTHSIVGTTYEASYSIEKAFWKVSD